MVVGGEPFRDGVLRRQDDGAEHHVERAQPRIPVHEPLVPATGERRVTVMEAFVSTEWLAARLDDPALRILDATVHLHPMPGGNMRAESGREDYLAGHIPGAVFADLIADLSDPESKWRFTLPDAARFGAAMGALGVSNDSAVVVYSGGSPNWAPRLWWMLRAFGHDRAAVLDGGWGKWKAEERPTAAGNETAAPAVFEAERRPGYFVGQREVEAALADPGAVVLNSLTPEQHAGGAPHYGRPGRIAGTVNVSSRDLVDPETGAMLPMSAVRQKFDEAGALEAERVVTYCGGGIAASLGAMALHLLGQENVAVYDDSLQAWARDPSLPMETG